MSSSTTLVSIATTATAPSSSSIATSATSTTPATSPATSDDATPTAPTSSQAVTSDPVSSTLPVTSALTSSSSSSLPISEPVSTSAVSSAITTEPTSTIPTTTSPTSTIPSTSSEPTITQPTSSDLSTSISVSSTTSAGTVYSTKVVYVSGTDANGSSYVSSTAISGGTVQNNTGSSGGGGNNIGAIVGGVVGGVVGLALLGAIAFFLWRKKKQPKTNVLDEKMFDPSRTARHSGGPNMPVDLVGDSFAGEGVSPYTGGMGSKAAAAGYGGAAALAGAGAGMGAYHHSRQPSEPRYPYNSRGSMDSTVYSGTTDPYMNNMAGMGAGAMGANPNGGGRVQPGYFAGGYGSNSGHDTMPQSPNRMSGGWAVAAAMGNNDQDGGYTSRDYAGYPYPRGGMPTEREQYPAHPAAQHEPAGHMDESRMSAGALAKLREARGPSDHGSAGPSGHGRRPSSQGITSSQSYDGGEDYYGRNSGGDPRQSRTSEVAGDDRRESLVQHDDAGPFREEEEGHSLPAELPPTYNSVPR